MNNQKTQKEHFKSDPKQENTSVLLLNTVAYNKQ